MNRYCKMLYLSETDNHSEKDEVGKMTLYEAARQYNVYLQSLHLSKAHLKAYRSGLQDIISFYGSETPLDSMDDSNVLDYVSVNDPFDCDPVHTQRGHIFCTFVHWLMRNRMIPAWAHEMDLMDQERELELSENAM